MQARCLANGNPNPWPIRGSEPIPHWLQDQFLSSEGQASQVMGCFKGVQHGVHLLRPCPPEVQDTDVIIYCGSTGAFCSPLRRWLSREFSWAQVYHQQPPSSPRAGRAVCWSNIATTSEKKIDITTQADLEFWVVAESEECEESDSWIPAGIT